jgi:uncharacterized protein with HEPN domain
MSPEERDPAYLLDMLLAARDVSAFVEGRTFEQYLENRQLRLAVERGLEIIGEASRRVSASFKASHPEIPWREVIGLRNVLAHEYGEVKQDRIWEIATRSVPGLIRRLEPLVPPESS